jgi:CDP-diacylglycerol--glycerol-3-phosphate 3-phosphatidyltransferase
MWIVVVFAMLSAVSYFRKFWRKVDARIKKRRRRELLLLERKRQQELMAQRGSRGSPDLRAATIWKPPEVS